MKYYTFNQNDSGGSFDYNENKGISNWVIIQAKDAQDANERAQSIGIYFNGIDQDIDCPCCGDRWYEVDNTDGTDSPMIYSTPVEKFNDKLKWIKGYQVFVHDINGNIKGYDHSDKE